MHSALPHSWSVRRKLFAGALLTSLVAVLLTGASLFVYDLHGYRTTTSTDLAIQAELLGHATAAALEFDDRAVANQNLSFLAVRPTVRRAAVYQPGGELFATYSRADLRGLKPPAQMPALGIAIEGDRVTVSHRIAGNSGTLGTVYLEADLGMGQRIASYAAITFAVALAALGVALLLSARLQSGITRPIAAISDVAHRVVAKRDYAVRAIRTTDDEIGTLVDAFNEMLSEIEARTAAIERSRDEIAQLNTDLESRVRERTMQLEDSNLRLQAADIAKSRFLSTMSHEIRTPMNGVLGMLELLSLTALDPQQRVTLNIVQDSGRSLLRIIDDILDFSKIEAGKLEVRPEVSSIPKIVAAVVGIYSGNASSKALTIRSRVDSRISPAVRVDPLRLQQILNNLVSNAIKFTAKGFVEIRAELVERTDNTDVVRFSVQDTGIGISPEGQARLFEPFAQAGGEVTRVFGGTGLGLSISRRLASLMDGTIEMESELDKGTTMILTLPLPIANADELPQPGAAPEGESSRAATLERREAPTVEEAEREGTLVLVVDDHPINRLVLMRQVTVLGYATETANDGREALEKWQSGRFKLVITDCNMPEMDGYELARAIRAMEKRPARTTIIACTANALRGEAENCFAAGMDDYVSKPVEISRLLAKLDQWLPLPDRRAARPPRRDPPPIDAVPVDLSVLAELAGGDTDLEKQVLAEFKAFNDADVGHLSAALQVRDAQQVVQFAHRIKGASRTLGANALAEVCGRLEAAAREGDWGKIDANERVLRLEAARLAAYLAKMMA